MSFIMATALGLYNLFKTGGLLCISGKSQIRQIMQQVIIPATLIAAILLGTFCVYADQLLNIPEINRVNILRALTDSLIHGIVGLWTWAIVMHRLSPSMRCYLAEVVVCGIAACVVDVDHFLAARSLKLKDALSLSSRPPFHNTTLIPVTAILLCLTIHLTPLKNRIPYATSLLFVAAWLSHHVRDGTRRGLWMWPFGSTPPIPYWAYIGAIVLLPFVWRMFTMSTYKRWSEQKGMEIV